jgi:hypothetical protein
LLSSGFFSFSRRLEQFTLPLLELLHGSSQYLAEDDPTPIDLAQAGVAAALGDRS